MTTPKEYPKIQSLYKRCQEKGPGYMRMDVGKNIRVSMRDGVPVINGRTDRAQVPAHLLAVLLPQFSAVVDQWYAGFSDAEAVTLYGEGVGPKIKKSGGNYGSEPFFVGFDVSIGGLWLERSEAVDVFRRMGVLFAPLAQRYGDLIDMTDFARRGFPSSYGAFQAEGVVAKPVVDLVDGRGNRNITKLKTKDFAQ